MNPAVEKFYEAMQGVQQKAQHGIEAIEMEISHKRTELADLEKALADARKILYAVNPSLKPKPKSRRGGPSVPSNGKRVGVSEEKIAALLAWLSDGLLEKATFSGPEIMASENFGLMSEPTLRAALDVLHERGQITLDHVGGDGGQQYRRKNYRLVQA